MTKDSQDSTGAIAREHLLTGAFDARIDRIEAHRITLQPAQRTGRHAHPGGIVSNVQSWHNGWGCDSGPGAYALRQMGSDPRKLTGVSPCVGFPSLAESLEKAHVSWRYYSDVLGHLVGHAAFNWN